jgi:hypothetical protein
MRFSSVDFGTNGLSAYLASNVHRKPYVQDKGIKHGMSVQRTVILAAATMIVAGTLRPTKATAQGAGAPTDLHCAHRECLSKAGTKRSREANGTPVMSKQLPDFPGKEVVIITVTYPPGSSGAVHRHNAHGFILGCPLG